MSRNGKDRDIIKETKQTPTPEETGNEYDGWAELDFDIIKKEVCLIL